jgi:hypothetical protein
MRRSPRALATSAFAAALLLQSPAARAFTGADIASLATANVGGMACTKNSLGGTSFFSSCTGNGGAPEYWCADFARWVWANTGVQYTSELTAAAGSFYVYGENHGTLKSTPAVGDAVVFNYAGGGVADHVAIVTKVNGDGTIETVSGDWNGDSGSEATFSSTSHCVLNAPAYPSAEGTSPGIMGMKISAYVAPVGLSHPDYAAAYVSQSFPLASSALDMVEGQTLSAYIELKNTGAKAWDSKTKLATTNPRDRASVFADASWLADNRIVAVKGTVAPGATYKFQFDFHAPDKPGTYFEYFNLVEEGVAWFSDPSQGGPADNDLEAQIAVSVPNYRGTFKAQSFPTAPAALSAAVGDVVHGYFELTNTGTQTWKAGVTKLAPIPRDKSSPFADSTWLSPTRVSSVAADVAPGAVGRFDVALDPHSVGDFTLQFGLVEEGVTWFADFPTGGGPADGALQLHLSVAPAGTSADGGVGTGAGDDAGATDPASGGDAASGTSLDAGPPGGAHTAASGGCSLALRPAHSPPALAPLSFIALATLAARRRRRHR